jgi:hypothetical protein
LFDTDYIKNLLTAKTGRKIETAANHCKILEMNLIISKEKFENITMKNQKEAGTTRLS